MKGKKWKRTAAALLAGIFVMTAAGCKGNDNEQTSGGDLSSTENSKEDVAKGRYVETMKETPEGVSTISGMVRLSDGSVAFINEVIGRMYLTKDNGDTWEEKELPSLEEKTGIEEIDITSTAIDENGGVFYSYVNWNADYSAEDHTVKEHYFYIDQDGNDREITFTDESKSFDFYLSEAVFIEDQVLAGVLNGGSVYRMDLKEGVIRSMGIPDANQQLVFSAGDYLMSSEQVYRISAQSTIEDSALTDFIREETKGLEKIAACLDGEEDTLYLASASGLYSHAMGGSTMEKLLDGGLCALGDPTKKATSILKNEDGSFLIAYDDGEIDLYAYDKDAPSVPARQISVYSLEQNATVSRAISMFRKSNPDVYVKQEIGLSGDYGMTKEDAVRNLNTRLLAEEGPDVLLLDELPVDSYVEKEILADLSETAEELEKNGSYFSNILRAYQNEKGLYAIPVRFRIPVLIGEKERIERIKNIDDLAKEVKDARNAHPDSNTMLGTYTAKELLKRLYEMVSVNLKDGEKPDKEEILNFLTRADEIYGEEQKNITPKLLEMHNNSITWMEEYGTLKQYENLTIDSSAAMDFLSQNQFFMVGKLSGMNDFQMLESLPKNKDSLDYTLIGDEKGAVFSPNGIAGVNDKSKEKELAVLFLQELLGEHVQKSDLEDGFPVNGDAFESFTKNPNPSIDLGFSASVADEEGNVDQTVTFDIQWPSAEEISAMKERILTLKSPSLSDRIIFDAVIESGVKVLEDSMTVDEGCDEIVQKVDLYLAE